MSDYYLKNIDKTFSLYSGSIFVNNGSGSNVSLRRECTQYWFVTEDGITIYEMLEISNQVSGSRTYMSDRGWI